MPISPFLKDAAFQPEHIAAMSQAFEDVCSALQLRDPLSKEVMAIRIIELARRGETDPIRLRELAVVEAGLGDR